MKEVIFQREKKNHVGVQRREEAQHIIFSSYCRCGLEQLFNLMSVCKYCKQSKKKKKSPFLFLEENDDLEVKLHSLSNSPPSLNHSKKKEKKCGFIFRRCKQGKEAVLQDCKCL